MGEAMWAEAGVGLIRPGSPGRGVGKNVVKDGFLLTIFEASFAAIVTVLEGIVGVRLADLANEKREFQGDA